MTTQYFLPRTDLPTPEKQVRAVRMRNEMTEAERILWSRLKAARSGFHFRRQCVIFGFIADFYCHEAKLVIEVDGKIHDSHQEYDDARDDVLREAGLLIIRFSNNDVIHDLKGVMRRIYNVALCRTSEP